MTDTILDGRVALVTGSASGIGAAVAARFRAAGAHVAGLDVQAGSATDCDLIADLCSDHALADAHADLLRRLGPPDIVVHAAAASVPGGTLDTEPADYARLYDVNVIGAVRLMRLCVPAMREKGGGAIVLLSSINARFATPTLAAYAATKAALESLTRTAAEEFAGGGIRVNAIAPDRHAVAAWLVRRQRRPRRRARCQRKAPSSRAARTSGGRRGPRAVPRVRCSKLDHWWHIPD